jgi:hypothetical protein
MFFYKGSQMWRKREDWEYNKNSQGINIIGTSSSSYLQSSEEAGVLKSLISKNTGVPTIRIEAKASIRKINILPITKL